MGATGFDGFEAGPWKQAARLIGALTQMGCKILAEPQLALAA